MCDDFSTVQVCSKTINTKDVHGTTDFWRTKTGFRTWAGSSLRSVSVRPDLNGIRAIMSNQMIENNYSGSDCLGGNKTFNLFFNHKKQICHLFCSSDWLRLFFWKSGSSRFSMDPFPVRTPFYQQKQVPVCRKHWKTGTRTVTDPPNEMKWHLSETGGCTEHAAQKPEK